MKYQTDDLRIQEIKELATPAQVLGDFPITPTAARTVYHTRQAIHRILHGADDRLLTIMGPCSIHDVKAAKEYAGRLKEAKDRYADDLLIVMRVYFEKPRTTVGWKGLINDPNLDGSFRINDGLRVGRQRRAPLLAQGASPPESGPRGAPAPKVAPRAVARVVAPERARGPPPQGAHRKGSTRRSHRTRGRPVRAGTRLWRSWDRSAWPRGRTW